MTDLEITDEELLDDFIMNGNENSFTILIKRHEKPLHKFVNIIMRDEDKAKDMCQEAFLQVSQKAYQFKGLASFKSWLYTIAKHECYKVLKKCDRIDWNTEADQESLESSSDDSGLSQLLNEEEKSIIQSCIKRLPKKQQTTIELRFNRQLKFKEIAKSMGCEVNTAKSNCCHAYATLKKLMESKSYW